MSVASSANRHAFELPSLEAFSSAPGWALASFGVEHADFETCGFADVELGDEVGSTTRFRWFSVSKLVTAVCVLRSIEDERIGLDDDVRAVLRWFRPGARVTVRQLLAHCSGLANPSPLGWVHPPRATRRDSRALTLDTFARHRRLRFEPDAVAHYTNLGYLVLGELVAELEGSFEQAALAALSDAGAHTASFDPSPCARGHEKLGALRSAAMALLFHRKTPGLIAYLRDGWVGLTPFGLEGAAYGGLVGSIEDLAAFGRALLKPNVVLSRASLELMRRPRSNGPDGVYGLGLLHHTPGWVGHGGAAGGYRAELFIEPARQCGVAVLTNAGDAQSGAVLEALQSR